MQNLYSFHSYTLAVLCLLLSTAFGSLSSQSTLGAGDVAFTLLNSEGNNDDAFAFLLLTPVEAGTVVRVTDKEYFSGVGFEDPEGTLTITFNQAYACGLEVFITDSNPANAEYDFTASEPGISVGPNIGNGFQLSTAGETLIMFRGDNLTNPCATCFITALANTGVGFGATATGSGDLPPGLTIGQSAMAMTANPDGDEWDNIKYDCSTTQADPAVLRTALMTPANWLTDDAAPLPTTPCVPSFSCSAPCIAPVINSVTVTNCGGGPNGFVTLTVNGQLNGAANWEWRGTSGVDEQPCDQQLNLASGPTLTVQFNLQDLTFYVVATGGCLSEEVCFAYVPSEVLGVPAFAPLTDLCVSSGLQSGLGGGAPTGGVYSGTGVTDDGNGMTFSFDPAVTGAGSQTVTYTISIVGNPCGETTAGQTIEVLAAPNVSMTTGALSVAVDAPVQTMLDGGTPTGGVYSGTGVTDNGNGMTYTFDPAVAGVGVTQVTYSFTDANGCSATASDNVTVEAGMAVAGNECPDATDLSALFGQPVGAAQTSGLFNNDDATTEASDPDTGFDCFGEPDGGSGSPSLDNTLWFTFTGDGETYVITTVECSATDYIDDGDTQIAIYTGDCGSLTGVACNEDAPGTPPAGPYPAEVTFPTEDGVVYQMIIDGFNFNGSLSSGEFCVEVTRSTDVAVTNIAQTDIAVFPNPTTGQVSLRGATAHRIDVYEHTGRLVATQLDRSNEVDLAGFAAGVYLLKIHSDERVYSAKVVKE